MSRNKQTDKQALAEWEEFLDSIRNSTPVDTNETEAEKQKRIKHLEKDGNQEEWFKYYFPKFSFVDPAPFHINSTKKVLATPRIYQRRAWARGLAKSTRRMFEIFYLMFVRKLPVNMLLISKSESNAIRLLAPYRGNLEGNPRIINDYGTQQRTGSKWAEEEFITRKRCSFRAVGAEQNPRGAKLDEMRVNVIVFDDVDDDEVCENGDRLNKRWNWVERAVLPTVEISKDYYIFFDNNIIAEGSIAVRAAEYANDVELVNLTDAAGNSTWASKNTDEDIADILGKSSYESIQTEYYNNPMAAGKTFPDMKYGKCPPLQAMQFVVAYADPSTSSKDKPTMKSKAQNSTKAVVLLGFLNGKFYLYKAYVDNTTNSTFIDWLYAIRKYVAGRCPLYIYIENNTLQDPFFQQVFLPLIASKASEYDGGVLYVIPDTRTKPEKWFRIEATLEPLNRMGDLILNEEEKEDPHMKRLVAQFKSAKATSRTLDGPDAVEGGVHIIRGKIIERNGGISTTPRIRNERKSI